VMRPKALQEIREGWRSNVGASGDVLTHVMTAALDRIGYLRVNVPKRRLSQLPKAASLNYAWFEEENAEKKKENSLQAEYDKDDIMTKTNWGFGNIDPDMLKRHKSLLDRQYFMGNEWKGKPKPRVFEDLTVEDQMREMFTPPKMSPRKINKQTTNVD